MRYVKLGAVRAFPGSVPDKAQALKVLEEAAEVFGAWQLMRDTAEARLNPKHETAYLMDEIADTITACCNLARGARRDGPDAAPRRVRGAES